jgi:hypothetical protein
MAGKQATLGFGGLFPRPRTRVGPQRRPKIRNNLTKPIVRSWRRILAFLDSVRALGHIGCERWTAVDNIGAQLGGP